MAPASDRSERSDADNPRWPSPLVPWTVRALFPADFAFTPEQQAFLQSLTGALETALAHTSGEPADGQKTASHEGRLDEDARSTRM